MRYLALFLIFLGGDLFKTITFFIFLTVVNSCLATDVVRYVVSEKYPDPKNSYFVELLTLALENTKKEYGDYNLQPVVFEMGQERTSKMLERNELIDLTWRMTSKELESRLQAIYVPLLKGMMGYRIFIIRADDQDRFTKNTLLSELKVIPVGQGINWPDTDILKSNHFTVIQGYYNNLLKMLSKNRFHYFPRGLHEPWSEIQNNHLFIVVKNIALKYYAPIFFFVNKANTRLNDRLNLGLTKLIKSGEFNVFFTHHPMTSDILDKVNLKSRTIFELANPLISKKTQALVDDKNLWLEFQ